MQVPPLGNATRSRRTSAVRQPESGPRSVATWVTAVIGFVLVVLSTLPVYRLLDSPDTGLAGASTVGQLDIYHEFVWAGLLLLLPVFLLGARLVPATIETRLAAGGAWLGRFRSVPFATALALLSAAIAAVFVLFVLEGLPNLLDSIAQLLHARYWAEGRLAGPTSDGGGFWMIQNSLFTERGWVSQYPPGHILVLATFIRLGVPWAAGPIMVGVTVFFASLLAERLFPGRRALARAGALLLAVSPFFLGIGASYMNHVTSAAMTTLGAYALVRAWHGRSGWALLAGAAFAVALATRPLSAVAMGAAIFLLVPFTAAAVSAADRLVRFLRIGSLTAIGAAPFTLLLLAYNRHFFGSPFAFGYEIALGPQMRLGFHQDPWGNTYGLQEAVAYTSADVLSLGLNLLETPLSVVLVIGLFLLVARRLTAGERVLAGWALAPVAANMLYWHHGLFMGPRMLHEAAPAWVLLFAAAAVGLIQRVPASLEVVRLRPRTGLVTTIAAALIFGLLVMAPQRLYSYGGGWMAMMRTPAPAVDHAALIFVHDAWTSRIGMTLATHGYRLDIVETLLRQNSTCRIHELAAAVLRGDRAVEQRVLAALDTVPRAINLPRAVEIAPDNRIRVAAGETLTPDCMWHARSDTRGILGLAPFLWRGDLTGDADLLGNSSGPLFVQDLGPERNAAMLARHPGRRPYVYMMPDPEAALPVLLPYDQGMALLWPAPDADRPD
jgi:hypothetical protein